MTVIRLLKFGLRTLSFPETMTGFTLISNATAPADSCARRGHADGGGDFEPMTILVVWSQHPLAGISRSRRRARFIPAPVSAGTTPLITLRSGHRPRRQAPVRNYPRHS